MSSTSQTLTELVDTYAGSGSPSTSFSDAKRLGLETSVAQTYLHAPKVFPAGATIVSATLRVYTLGAWNITPILTVQRIGESWKQSLLTWNTKPGVTGATATATQTSNADGNVWAFDVVPLLQQVADGARWYGFRIITNSAVRKYLYSAEAVSFRPTLDVTWSEAPQAPSTLSPSGNRSVAVAKPVLRFDFTDHLGSTSLQSVQVQVNTTNVWTSPSFDSGTVASTVPQLDLAATAYGGLANAGSTYWRVRVQDGSGLWSVWSDAAQFSRSDKGTLAITNPAVSPNNFVSEWTPPISWTLTGETQTGWQVQILSGTDSSVVLYDSGRVTGTATAKTLPKGVLKNTVTYTVLVRVWDSKDREGTPGAPPYTELTRGFTFNEDATVTAVASLTATSTAPQPWVTLQWTRATAPDSFTVRRDGVTVATGLLAVDLLVSGTTYRYVDYTAAPNRSHTWIVQAVVNAKTSASNPTVSYAASSTGIFLYDLNRSIEVSLSGGHGSQWGTLEQGETFIPLGAQKPVRITQTVGGVAGTITDAAIQADGGQTANTWETRLVDIKSRPGREVVLVYGDKSFPAVISNIEIRPITDDWNADPAKKYVNFNFWQVGAFDDVVL